MPPAAIIDPNDFPTKPILDLEAIRKINQQRFEMEQLTAVTLVDVERRLAVGYKDVTMDEFWVRGHMPDFPIMPGVIICEAAAQLCSVFTRQAGVVVGDFIGFAGMDEVRFRGAVRPGNRLWLVAHTDRYNNRRMTFHMQAFVERNMVFHGDFLGVPLQKAEE